MGTTRPLSDIRVLDFGQYLAGPLVGMMLADLGAEVIRIDPPGGPRLKTPASAMLSRGKTAVTLDLKTAEGRQSALDLAARSDAVIENFRPGVMGRLGLSPEDLRAVNPDLVTLSMPGFASSDPELGHLPAWEAIIAARSGQFTDMGLNRRLMGINPSFTPLALASAYGAAFGALSLLFALLARDRNGGEHIEVPLASALLEGLAYNCLQVEDYPERYKSPREVELDRRAAEGLPMNLSFEALSEFLDPFYRTYACAEGRGFYVVAGSVRSHPARVLETLGLEDLLAELPAFNPYLDSKDWPASWSLWNYPVGAEDRARVAAAMKQAFLTRSADEWEDLFGSAKAPATQQRRTAEWLKDPHALASGLILEVTDPAHGAMRQMGNVAWLGEDEAAAQKRPCLEQEAARQALDRLLAEPARSHSGAAGNQPWLEGLKVLDLTNVIAGPTIGSTLARFGAEIIAVQPVEPSVDPWNTVIFGIYAQRGKRSALLSLSTDAGRSAFDRLIAWADVITFNGTDQQRDKLGLNPDRLNALKPGLILTQLDAFGGPNRGPKSDHLGYDDLAQAATGVMLRFGGGMETPEEHAHFGTIDVLAGFCGAVGLAAALVRRQRTGEGGLARASLAAAGNLIQAPFMYDFEGRAPFDEPSGRAALGWGPFYHCYQAADGWFFLAAPDGGGKALAEVDALSDLAALPETDLQPALAQRFQSQPFAVWEALLCKGSVALVRLGSLQETRDGALQLESQEAFEIKPGTYQVIRHDQHPMGRWCDLVVPNAVRPEKAPIILPAPMPKYGTHTRAVLRSLGYDDTTIELMIEEGAAGEAWSERYLPE